MSLRQWQRISLLLHVAIAASSCIASVSIFLWGLIYEGPAFYNGSECRMTYSQFQFLPLQVVAPPPTISSQESTQERYRLLKFTDSRDPRHRHLYQISGSMIENYESQSNPRRRRRKTNKDNNEVGATTGRLLEMHDNWCLLPQHTLNDISQNITSGKWAEAPFPHRGHPVLYVPGHWGSFSQSRSLGAHGTRWTGPYAKAKSDQEIYDSLRTGKGMHDGLGIFIDGTNISSSDHVMDWLTSTQFQQQRRNYLNGFVMDVFALDFDGEGAALHSSILVRQADYFARAVLTVAKGCHLHPSNGVNISERKPQSGGITIVAHSIGAWVVRIAMKRHPALFGEGYIRNIVTLASPLGSIPYAVDAGVHELVNGLNNGAGYAVDGDSAMISISGGLRDEMIPPEVCEVPNNLSSDSTQGIVTSAIHASSMMRKDSTSSTSNDRFGMDHRAIVWCYDLLTVIREVIFSLVVATDKSLVSSERMDIAMKIMQREQNDSLGVYPSHNESHSIYQEQVNNQQLQLLQVKGYWRTMSIQLSALHHLNSLMKLFISAALLDTYLIHPWLKCLRRDQTTGLLNTRKSISDRWLNIALGLVVVPSVIVMVAWMQRCGSWKSCNAHKSHLLLGTIFTLAQVATTCYYFTVHWMFSLVAFTLRMRISPHVDSIDKSVRSSKKTFWGILLQLSIEQLRSLTLIFFPLTVFTCISINTFLFQNDDLVWNKTALASYCFITLLFHNVVNLIVVACQPCSQLSLERRRGEIMTIMLLMVKDSYGKVLNEFNLTTKWGQNESYSQYDFVPNKDAEKIIAWIFAAMALFTIVVLRTHDRVAHNFTSCWNLAKANVGDCDTAIGSRRLELGTLNNMFLHSRFFIAARACVACWFTWNVLRNNGMPDDIMIPICTSMVVVETYLKCQLYNFDVIDVCSAIANNDLGLDCDSPRNHDKHE